VLDLVREHVAWFSDRNDDAPVSWVVEVISPE
jgi:Uma2 family endonuclease